MDVRVGIQASKGIVSVDTQQLPGQGARGLQLSFQLAGPGICLNHQKRSENPLKLFQDKVFW